MPKVFYILITVTSPYIYNHKVTPIELCTCSKHSGRIKAYYQHSKTDGVEIHTPMNYTAVFHGSKNANFLVKNCDIFLFCSKYRS